jgi:O-antigen/teichoic acid export membrane protein
VLSIVTTREPWSKFNRTIRDTWVADSLRGRFARGAFWSLAGALISQAANLAASVITARLLGREGFGKYGMIQSTLGTLGIFAGLGLGVTATKYVAGFRTSDPERAGRIVAFSSAAAIVTGALLALGLLTYAPIIAAKTLNARDLTVELRIASVLLFLNAINGAQTGALIGFEAFQAIAGINLMRGLLVFPVTAIAVLLWQLPGAIWALVITAAVQCLVSHILLRRQCAAIGIHAKLASGWAERGLFWTFSLPAFLSGALAGPVVWAASTILVNQPRGYAEMGVFSAASQWSNAIAFIPGVIAQFALPLLSSLNGEQDMSRYGRALRWNLILSAAAAVAVAAPIALGAPYIMRLYGRDFQQGAPILVLSAAAAVMSSINGVVGTAILSAGSVWVGFAFNGMWAAVLLTSAYRFIPTSLALGLAGSMLCAYAAHTIWQAAYLHRQISFHRSHCGFIATP